MSSHALIATAHYHGDVVQHRFEAGERVLLDGESPLPLPLPAGVDYLANAWWVGPGRVQLEDAMGRAYTLKTDETLELEFGDLLVTLEVTPQFGLQRDQGVGWRLSTSWLVLVLLFTIFSSWYEMISVRKCQIFAVTPELAVRLGCVKPNTAGNHPGADFTAEYLARLLEEDLEGDEDGVLRRMERPDTPVRDANKREYYLPSGNRGPTDTFGGAEDVAPESIKAPRSEHLPTPEESEAAPVVNEPLLEAPEDIGTPIERPEESLSIDDGKGEDVVASDSDGDDAEQPAEEREGWGLQDWYDVRDQQLDQREIDKVIELADRRLRIDPNDPMALSLLSYYQYLDEDYAAAEQTYDRYIDLLPNEASGYNNKALIYKRRKEYKKEERLYRVALSLEPLDVTAMNNLGVNLSHQGRHAEALAVMEQLEFLDPDDAYSDLHRAKIHAEMGNDEQAYRYLRKSLEGMAKLDTLHHIEFRQDIRLDPSFNRIRESERFISILYEFYGEDAPVKD